MPLPQSATLGLNPVARKLLVISRPAKGSRLLSCILMSTRIFVRVCLPSFSLFYQFLVFVLFGFYCNNVVLPLGVKD